MYHIQRDIIYHFGSTYVLWSHPSGRRSRYAERDDEVICLKKFRKGTV